MGRAGRGCGGGQAGKMEEGSGVDASIAARVRAGACAGAERLAVAVRSGCALVPFRPTLPFSPPRPNQKRPCNQDSCKLAVHS
eukprot:556870-Pyramimonas_sp.AAC.1